MTKILCLLLSLTGLLDAQEWPAYAGDSLKRPARPERRTTSPPCCSRVRPDGGAMSKGRVETLADGVCAIAMTLLAFNLQPPSVPAAGHPNELRAALFAMAPHFRSYILSFVVIGIYWLGHHTQFHYVLQVDRTLLWINIFFLMFIATLPFSTAVLGRYGHYQPAVFLYSGNLLLVGWMNATHWAYITRRRRLVAPDLPADFVRITMARILTTPVVALVSVAVSYIDVTWAVYFYYAIVIFYVLLARVRSHSSPGGDTI